MTSNGEPIIKFQLVSRIAQSATLFALLVLGTDDVSAQERAGKPQAPSEILYLMRFRLGNPYADLWSADREAVSSGAIAAISLLPVDRVPGLSTQTLVFCDGGLAEPLNSPAGSGVVIAILPERCFRTHSDTLDASVWSALTSDLPERLLRENLTEETTRLRSEVGESAVLRRTLKQGAVVQVLEPQFFASKKELLRAAAELIRRYAPEDEDVALGFSVPLERTFSLPSR